MRTLAAVIALAFGALPAAAAAQPRPVPEVPILSVSGQGVVSRAPDQATLGLQIVTNNDAAAAATSQNNTVYNALKSRLASIRIADTALHTRYFNMNFVPKPQDGTSYKPPRTGYVVTRGIDVTVNDLSAVGRAIDAAVAAGVSDVGNVTFGLRDRRGAYASALAAAMQDAYAQAVAVAEAAHMRLGGIRSINTSGYLQPPPAPMFAARAAVANVPTEVPASDIDVRASVNVTYVLK